ncbi:hypothetical protein CDAR_507341 [Caerostris darwini]|uniref:Uncharacterized protein n=1 Tax=Caerostris darwini TaxID=1538125 RepID=A0AAV4WEJ8_9ARAC|nr:hypothetical protein CDAR_507341 [Caerostris darwini]
MSTNRSVFSILLNKFSREDVVPQTSSSDAYKSQLILGLILIGELALSYVNLVEKETNTFALVAIPLHILNTC